MASSLLDLNGMMKSGRSTPENDPAPPQGFRSRDRMWLPWFHRRQAPPRSWGSCKPASPSPPLPSPGRNQRYPILLHQWRCAMVLLCFFRCLLGCCRLFLFLCVKRLDFRCFVAGTAVVALQFPGFSHKVERASASRALIVGDLCWHLIPSFPVPGDSSIKACNTPVNPNDSRPLWGGSHAYRFSLLGHQATEKILLPLLNGSVTGTSCC